MVTDARRIGCAALLLLTAAAPLPGVGDGVRRPVDGSSAPWSSLVRVQVAGQQRCTGIVVGPRAVLTAAHCLYLARAGHFAPPASVHVLAFYTHGTYGAHVLAAGYRTLEGWQPQGGRFGRDGALLTLAAPIAAPALALAAAVALPAPAMLGGYNQDRAEVLAADADCRLLGVARDAAGERVLQHDCAATRGTSGAALLVREGAGWAVAGLQSGAAAGQGGVAVPAEALRELLGSGG